MSSHDDSATPRPERRAVPHRPDPRDTEVPPGLVSTEIGLSPQRLRALLAADDAYTRRRADDDA